MLQVPLLNNRMDVLASPFSHIIRTSYLNSSASGILSEFTEPTLESISTIRPSVSI